MPPLLAQPSKASGTSITHRVHLRNLRPARRQVRDMSTLLDVDIVN
jgi:hypothetical protein